MRHERSGFAVSGPEKTNLRYPPFYHRAQKLALSQPVLRDLAKLD